MNSREQFETEGFIGPFKLFNPHEIKLILDDQPSIPEIYTWNKSIHEYENNLSRAARHPAVVEALKSVIGEDILLWGTTFVNQAPGISHGWHLDVEFGRMEGCTLWLGLENLNEKTILSLITRSHLIGTTPQELSQNEGIDIYDDRQLITAAKKKDKACELKQFILEPGEFVIWTGKLWHTTSNQSSATRKSIIFQYCNPAYEAKAPANYDYPNTIWQDLQPPCLLINGRDRYGRNKLAKIGRFAKFLSHLYSAKLVYRRMGKRSLVRYILSGFKRVRTS